MADAHGWEFILFSVVFYAFMGAILFVFGGWNYLAGQLPGYAQSGYQAQAGLTNINFLTQIWIVLTNPLSSVGFISWLSAAFGVVDIFIIITDLIP